LSCRLLFQRDLLDLCLTTREKLLLASVARQKRKRASFISLAILASLGSTALALA
jgi:hypothetical protein